MTNPTRYDLEDGALEITPAGQYVTYLDLSAAVSEARGIYIGTIQELRQEVNDLQARLDVYEG